MVRLKSVDNGRCNLTRDKFIGLKLPDGIGLCGSTRLSGRFGYTLLSNVIDLTVGKYALSFDIWAVLNESFE